ncbi:hypothetical protein NBRC110019_15750 [Neptunitalea chrysea]|uniref:50S ribosomal protein L27 n=1 Tax=Neptunitalea chrysea TaxID=1647581 RepID=A0A9W6ETT8_9FLAO|nr:hypothetical protein [Neptunitalea chrysea]GLB52535.1 hypothetical protein NBRC110019_15750 [Neptunitalea chrysea]
MSKVYNAILTIHSYWAYLVLLILFLATINAIVKFITNKPFTDKDLRISLFGLIVSHIQLLIGIVLYFVSPRFSQWSELGAGVMKNPLLRKVLLEHPLTNVIAIALITIGWSVHKKKTTAKAKFGKIAFFYMVGLLLFLLMIPYQLWFD